MSELISICFSPIVRALLIWTPVLMAAVMLPGVGLFWLARRRFRRRPGAGPGGPGKPRVWTVRLLLIATQAVFLPILTLITAIPFALHQGAADAIESASPRILDWGVRTGARAVGKRLSVSDSAAVVDLGKLAPVLRTVGPAAARGREWLKPLSVVPRLATSAYYRALDLAMEQAARTKLRITWGDLLQSARRSFSGLWAGQARAIASLLRASSLHFIHVLAVATLLVDLLCLLVIFLLAPDPAGGRVER